jgi:hypothetical protein
VPAPWFEYGAGDGSLACTAEDLAVYLRMLLGRGRLGDTVLLPPERFDAMIQRTVPVPDAPDSTWYGYGLFVRRDGGHTILSHTGGMVGYCAMMNADLDDGLGAVVLANGPERPNAIAEYALALLQAAYRGQPLPEPPPLPPPTRVANAAQYAGLYRGREDDTLVIEAAGEELVLVRGDRRIALQPRGADRFLVDDPEFALHVLRFGRRDSTVVEAMHGDRWYRNDAYRGPRRFEVPRGWDAYPGHYRTQNPWSTNFRIVLVKGRLWIAWPQGELSELVPITAGLFRVGSEAWSAERLRIDQIVRGRALRVNLTGVDYYRTFTP